MTGKEAKIALSNIIDRLETVEDTISGGLDDSPLLTGDEYQALVKVFEMLEAEDEAMCDGGMGK